MSIKLIQLIQESFNTVYNYHKIKLPNNASDEDLFEFKTENNETYQVSIYYDTLERVVNNYIRIGPDDNIQDILSLPIKVSDKYPTATVEFIKYKSKDDKTIRSYQKHPTIDFMKVLSTINNIIIKSLENSGMIIIFSSKEKNRTKFYNRLVDKLASNKFNKKLLPGYNGESVFFLIPKEIV